MSTHLPTTAQRLLALLTLLRTVGAAGVSHVKGAGHEADECFMSDRGSIGHSTITTQVSQSRLGIPRAPKWGKAKCANCQQVLWRSQNPWPKSINARMRYVHRDCAEARPPTEQEVLAAARPSRAT